MMSNGTDVTLDATSLAKIKVIAEVINHARGRKIKITKFKRRKYHDKTIGHRQNFTELKILEN